MCTVRLDVIKLALTEISLSNLQKMKALKIGAQINHNKPYFFMEIVK